MLILLQILKLVLLFVCGPAFLLLSLFFKKVPILRWLLILAGLAMFVYGLVMIGIWIIMFTKFGFLDGFFD